MSDEATDQRENIESMALALKMIREKDAEIVRLKAAMEQALDELKVWDYEDVYFVLRAALGEKP